MTTLKVALDWTPNVNHIGILVANELGFYNEEQLQIDILNPLADNYAMTPGKKLETGMADIAVAPFETVISLNNKANKVEAIAIYAILQEDMSSIVTLQSSELSQPKQLDGKVYASYKARYEDHIVKEMVKNDGGTGNVQLVYPDKLGIWNTLLDGKADATWIFDNWEGVEAENRSIALNRFKLDTFSIPYGYSPVILTTKTKLAARKEDYSRFVKATQNGYQYAAENQREAAQILTNYLTDEERKNIDIDKALAMTAPHFSSPVAYGFMESQRVEAFLQWLADRRLEHNGILEQTLFTNELLG